MKLTLTHYDTTITIESEDDGLTGDQFIDELVRPLMLAAGYHPSTVADALNEDPPSVPKTAFDDPGDSDGAATDCCACRAEEASREKAEALYGR